MTRFANINWLVCGIRRSGNRMGTEHHYLPRDDPIMDNSLEICRFGLPRPPPPQPDWCTHPNHGCQYLGQYNWTHDDCWIAVHLI